MVLGPLIAALVCSTRQVARGRGGGGSRARFSARSWVTDPFSFAHLVQQLTVVLGSGLSILAAMNRERHADGDAGGST